MVGGDGAGVGGGGGTGGHLKPHSACRPLFRQKNQVFNSLSIIKIFSKKEIKHSIFSIALLLIF